MDEHTLEKLDFARIRQLVSGFAQCGLGKSLAARIQPSKRKTQIQMWLDQAREFAVWTALHGLPPFGGIRDVRDMVKRAIPPARLEPGELADLASTLAGIDDVRRYFTPLTEAQPLLSRLAGRIGDFRVVTERIYRVIDRRGQVRDDASERLERIRREIEEIKQKTRDVFDRLVRDPAIIKVLQYSAATFHADRMVLPLKADQRGRIQGIIHRSSDSGQTLFIEPAEAVELNNSKIVLLQEEREEIGRILWEITHFIHLNQEGLLHTLDAVAVVDLLSAKERFARQYDMHIPQLNDEHRLSFKQARNPILLAMFAAAPADQPKRTVVPIDVRLGEDFDIMLITGPNTGGKTAALKTVGLLVLMAQSGLPIPAAEGSSLPVFDGVYIDVGDEQSLEQSLSTFSAHLARMLDILKHTQKASLVLLDELGAGTDPDEGAAIGRAIVDRLKDIGCLAMVTTHLGALKSMGFDHERVDNASVLFDIQTLRPMYELRIGEPGESHAIAIASRLGMPRKLVDDARKNLGGAGRALQRAIAGTLRSRRDAERARKDADNARAEAARATLAALDRADELEQLKKSYNDWVTRIIRLQPGDPVQVRQFDKPGRVVRVGLEKQKAIVAVGSLEVEVSLTDLVLGPA